MHQPVSVCVMRAADVKAVAVLAEHHIRGADHHYCKRALKQQYV
jgi:hypothetical protein